MGRDNGGRSGCGVGDGGGFDVVLEMGGGWRTREKKFKLIEICSEIEAKLVFKSPNPKLKYSLFIFLSHCLTYIPFLH